jgi:MFS family permease
MHSKKINFKKNLGHINKVIGILTLSDIFVWGTTLVANPLIAIYLTSKFGGNTLEYIGIGTAVYYAVRSLVQLPIGAVADRIKHDKDEIIFLVMGCILMAIPYFVYPYITSGEQYFFLMGLSGFGTSMNLNNWRKLFAKNLEKDHEGFSYGVYETAMSISTAIFGLLGGHLSSMSPEIFETVISSVGIFVLIGGISTALLLRLKRSNF